MEPGVIRTQVERILRSKSFASKGQLRKLLEVLSKNFDSQSGLNPDFVIRELWPHEIRTKRSADVATEMNRLRHALQDYYSGEGKTDPIRILLPNRSVPAADGVPEKHWIAAQANEPARGAAATDQFAEVQASPPRGPSERRPTRKTIGLVALIGTGLAIAIYFRAQVVHIEPKLGRLDGSALVIMNAEGKEIWRKVFPGGFGPDWYYEAWQPKRIWFGDLEGKGDTSVLFSYSPAGPLSHSSTLICYSDRGKEKWRWAPGKELPELAGSPATFITHTLGVLKARDKRPPRIVVASQHSPWWPGQIAILDSNGKTLSEYWHSGALSSMVLADLDGDGREEIIATGVANGYDHQATLVVLDPDRVFGASAEIRPEFQIHNMGVAQERLRLLFPRSDLNRALYQFNIGSELTFEHGSLRLTVLECITPLPGGCHIWYEFDRSFHLIAAYAGGDEFRSAHNRFFQSGKNAHALSAAEQAAFLKVRCLIGCKTEFVPVGNLVP